MAKPKARSEGKMLQVRIREDEERAFKKTAEQHGQNLSAWVRQLCRLAAGLKG